MEVTLQVHFPSFSVPAVAATASPTTNRKDDIVILVIGRMKAARAKHASFVQPTVSGCQVSEIKTVCVCDTDR